MASDAGGRWFGVGAGVARVLGAAVGVVGLGLAVSAWGQGFPGAQGDAPGPLALHDLPEAAGVPAREIHSVGISILSGTAGIDGYMPALRKEIERNWVVPDEAKLPELKEGLVGVRFSILPDGGTGRVTLETASGDLGMDGAAWAAVTTEPFPPLPQGFQAPALELRVAFFYNRAPPQFGGGAGCDCVRVAPETMEKSLVSRPEAVYPEAAKVEGAVVLDAVISKTGEVEKLNVVSGPEALRASALEAVRRSVYRPYRVYGEPVEVETTVKVEFALAVAGVVPKKIGNGVSAPMLIYQVEPKFDGDAWKESRNAGWTPRTPLVNLWVDELGMPTHVRVLRGYDWPGEKGDAKPPEALQKLLDGMNQDFVDAVKQYRFKPAMENGKPVVVELNVEVNIDVF